VHTAHISRHAVSSSTLKRQLGWAALTARILGAGEALLRRRSARGSGRRCVRAAGERVGDGSSGPRSEGGVDGAHRACTLADGAGHAFH
jgi:hypothetical protein